MSTKIPAHLQLSWHLMMLEKLRRDRIGRKYVERTRERQALVFAIATIKETGELAAQLQSSADEIGRLTMEISVLQANEALWVENDRRQQDAIVMWSRRSQELEKALRVCGSAPAQQPRTHRQWNFWQAHILATARAALATSTTETDDG